MKIVSQKRKVNPQAYIFTLATTISLALATQANAFNIIFDYTYDANNFFDATTTAGQNRRDTLTQAGQYYTDYISDNLSAISAGSGIADVGGNGGSNTWTTSFTNPATGSTENVTDMTVTEDTIVVYAGGRNISSLGIGGAGGFSAGGSSAFLDLIKARGQAGALTEPKTDIGLWGGSIAFDTEIVINVSDGMGNTTPTNFDWHNTTDLSGLDSNEADFMSVAIHELSHVFGFVTIPNPDVTSSWENQINGTGFEGTSSLAVYQAEVDPNATSVPLQSGSLAHWKDGTQSITLGGVTQEVALDPSVTIGQRKLLTNLDYAGLDDIGWEVNTETVPFEFSPGLGIVLMSGLFGSLSIRNRLRRKS